MKPMWIKLRLSWPVVAVGISAMLIALSVPVWGQEGDDTSSDESEKSEPVKSEPTKADGAKSDGKKAAGGRKSTTINFEDQLVEGQAQKPELFYLLQKKNANFKRLIRLRDDFLPEMRKTSEDVQRKGSGN